MDTDQILAELQTELSAVLDVDPTSVVVDARLNDTLGADSVDLIEVAGRFEQRYDIALDDRELHDLVTVGDFLGLLERKMA